MTRRTFLKLVISIGAPVVVAGKVLCVSPPPRSALDMIDAEFDAVWRADIAMLERMGYEADAAWLRLLAKDWKFS
jgi:hypothetical protein